MILKTNYANRVVSGTRKFQFHNKGDGTYTIEDKSIYSVEGDYYGAADLNKQNYVYNSLVDDYSLVDDLIAKLRTYGVTPTDNSPTSIINAINSLATSKYNAGRSTGQNAVVNDPNGYGLYSTAQYQAVTNKGEEYDNRISSAIYYLAAGIGSPSALNYIATGESNIADALASSEYYATHRIYENMTSSEAKSTRTTMKNSFEAQKIAYIAPLSNACHAVDTCLSILSI